MPEGRFILVMTTVNSRDQAEKIAGILVKEKAAACVSISAAVDSLYWWQEKITSDREWMLYIKTVAANYQIVERLIRENHPYEIPEIIALPVQTGAAPYLHWLEKNTRTPS